MRSRATDEENQPGEIREWTYPFRGSRGLMSNELIQRQRYLGGVGYPTVQRWADCDDGFDSLSDVSEACGKR
jgi:hypothetical protein